MKESQIKLHTKYSFVEDSDFNKLREKTLLYHNKLAKQEDDFTGWVGYVNTISKEEIDNIKDTAKKIKDSFNVIVVIGVGGSYLGFRACMEMINNYYHNELKSKNRKGPKVYFAGFDMCGSYHRDLLDLIKDENVSICVISKSGSTMEPIAAYGLFKSFLIEKYGQKAYERIYVVTDENNGPLREEVNKYDLVSFSIPSDIGGRYSVFTPGGLFPLAISGIDIEEFLQGAKNGYKFYIKNKEDNPALTYAMIRTILYKRGKSIEVFESYDPKLSHFIEWIKQLYGENEGKEKKGIFPTSLHMTRDLHSMGQFLQDGNPCFFETILDIDYHKKDSIIPDEHYFLPGFSYNDIRKRVIVGVTKAHVEDSTPNLKITVPELSEVYIGELFYFFLVSASISAYLFGVFPFDQPGVEVYKKEIKEELTNQRKNKEYILK